MSLLTALQSAASGLRTTQAGIAVVSQNVANAGSIGYSRRVLSPIESVAGDQASGVRAGQIERVLDEVAQKQLRLETAGAAYTALRASFARSIDQLLGEPGGVSSLDGAVNAFAQSLQQLSTDPASYTARTAVLDAGGFLASRISGLSSEVQSLRSEAESRIGSAVDRANELLSEIASVSRQITRTGSAASAPLLDQRDRLLNELSGLIDIKTVAGEGGSLSVVTTSGVTLFDGTGAAKLSFDGRGQLAPNSLYSENDAERSVGTIRVLSPGGSSLDLVRASAIRSGEIAAALELRDTTLVEAQRQLDELAAGLARAMSDRQAPVTDPAIAGFTGFDIDLAGLQAGNEITLDYRDNASASPGDVRRVIFIPTDGAAPATIEPTETGDPSARIVRLDMSGGFASAVGQISTALGVRFTVVQTGAASVRILDDGGAGTTDVVGLSAGMTVTGFAAGSPELPFFVDAGRGNTPFTGSFENGSHLNGFAQRIAVNPTLAADRSRLAVFNTSPTTPQGDATRPTFLADALTGASRIFSAASGIGGVAAPFASTVAGFARQIVETQASNAQSAQRLDEGQKVALSAIEGRFAESAGVSIDQEMTQLVQLQTAYSANARVMTAVRDMLDLLMRM